MRASGLVTTNQSRPGRARFGMAAPQNTTGQKQQRYRPNQAKLINLRPMLSSVAGMGASSSPPLGAISIGSAATCENNVVCIRESKLSKQAPKMGDPVAGIATAYNIDDLQSIQYSRTVLR